MSAHARDPVGLAPEHRPEGEGEAEWRYWYDNFAYAYDDGIVLHGMLRHLRPQRIVEVGSGFSSAMMLVTVDGWLPGTEVTFVEPYPEPTRAATSGWNGWADG